MQISIPRLRRWFALATVLVCLVVLGTYLYLHHRVQNALREVPEKIGINIQQSAQGFTISKSEQGRTLFKLQASKAIQFKQGGKVELHDVSITLYGRDSSRFDQVYGQDFEYDRPSGDVTSKGEVSIDLESNPKGVLNPDQAAPKELKDPIHLKTTGLVFNVKSGDARTDSTVEFRVPQASGSAVGARYSAKDMVLTLESRVQITVSGAAPSRIFADHAILEKSPRQVVLQHVRAASADKWAQADELVLFIRDNNTLHRAVASGNVSIQIKGAHAAAVSSQEAELVMKKREGVDQAILVGDVHLRTMGKQEEDTSAGRAVLVFGARNVLTKVHAENGVKLIQRQKGTGAQNVQVSSPAMNFFVAGNRRLSRAETIGPPLILIQPQQGQGESRLTADKFTAKFDDLGQLSSVHGEGNTRVVSTTAAQGNLPQPERVSTSDIIDAFFAPGTGMQAAVQQGRFTYAAGTQKASAERARYTAADQMIALSGSPRVVDAGTATTARSIRLNRSTGDAFAQGDVKTTYSDLKPQPNGAMLASSDPVHVSAQSMTANSRSGTATYSGGARLWQNANVVEAPTIQFQKEQRLVTASSNSSQKVSTVLVSTDETGKATPISVTADHLTYRDAARKAHFDGDVKARGAELTITAQQMDVFLQNNVEARASSPVPLSGVSKGPTGETPAAPHATAAGPARLEKIIATGSVLITEPNRRATGEQLTYTAADDKFVLTGGPPSIFDAEHGKITGVSLTLFRRDGRVVVEGDSRSPAVTETRVVR